VRNLAQDYLHRPVSWSKLAGDVSDVAQDVTGSFNRDQIILDSAVVSSVDLQVWINTYENTIFSEVWIFGY